MILTGTTVPEAEVTEPGLTELVSSPFNALPSRGSISTTLTLAVVVSGIVLYCLKWYSFSNVERRIVLACRRLLSLT